MAALTALSISVVLQPPPAQADAAALKPEARDLYTALPLTFAANAGQDDKAVRYMARGDGYSFAFTRNGVLISLTKPTSSGARSDTLSLALQFVGASTAARPEARRPAPGKVNYLVGDRSKWRTGLPTYEQLVYRDLWPGIDMAFKGAKGKLKYEFRLRPGADPGRIRLAYGGAESLALGAGGALQVKTAKGTLTDAAPLSYQRVGDRRVPVASGFRLGEAGGSSFGLVVGPYDAARALVIDPGLEYSTYLGGSSTDEGRGIAVEGHDVYLTGRTASRTVAGRPEILGFPVTPDAFQPAWGGGLDAFVTRLDTSREGAAALVYSTYLGGSDFDEGWDVAVEGHEVFVTGQTFSNDFPVTVDAFQSANRGSRDAFVTRLDTERGGPESLEYSTYLGGRFFDDGFGIEVRGHDAYLTGRTLSTDFPVTPDAFQPALAGGFGFDAFVTRLDTDREGAAGLEYSTYLGGRFLSDEARGIAVDGHDVYLAGATTSNDFPVTADAFQPVSPGGGDAFVTRLDTQRSGAESLEYSTYVGGSSSDQGLGVAVEAHDAFLSGFTDSQDFPVTPDAFQPAYAGSRDAVMMRIDTARSGPESLEYSTYLGGSSRDQSHGIAVEGDDSYLTGLTDSRDFPVTAGAFQPAYGGGFSDAFVTRLGTKREGAAGLEHSTYLGGSFSDQGNGIAVRGHDAYLTGLTSSSNFPVTPGAFQPINGGVDAFVTRLDTAE